VNLLSTGHPSTLKSYRELSSTFFGDDSAATQFLDKKIQEQGEEAEVAVHETQMIRLLAEKHTRWLEGKGGVR
jgi:hypothetical protein